MDIAISTSILCDTGSPENYLRLIAEAGFSHLHWGHHWNTDFLYSSSEIAQCGKWLKQYGLKMLDIHGSEGVEKQWFAPEEYRRRSGVELVLNRVVMLRELEGAGCVMMHLPPNRARKSTPEEERLLPARVDALRRSLDEIVPALERYDAKIAMENRRNDSFGVIAEVMAAYLAERIGITLDTGHANIDEARGFERMEKFKDRLMALHLNDNDGVGDLHQPPFYGTLDWERVAELVATSAYAGHPASF
ncbi:MAG: sugar phosphate isomerase/epimerase [Lentisphaeria bacterium]|nr:sugar phosphate isomerase/epimerase [Lentisphaeria bacterium]